MEETEQPSLDDVRVGHCSRCFQPVPPKASHCPACRQPVHTLRVLPWVAAAVGLFVLLFALFVVLRMTRNEQLRAPVDNGATQQAPLFPDPPPAGSQPKQPSKPEKRPPLDER